MNLISESTMEEFATWAKENEDKNIYPKISNEDSYYVNRDSEDTYMMEYSIKTMGELREALEQYSGLSADQQMLKKLVIELFQSRVGREINISKTEKDDIDRVKTNESETISEFIYSF